MTVRISTKGWVVIPADLRKKYALEPGDTVEIIDYGGVLAIVPSLDDPVKAAAGSLRGGASLTKALLEERRIERKREG
jgi:AbrB family looped-hinge helix DNA binding protein